MATGSTMRCEVARDIVKALNEKVSSLRQVAAEMKADGMQTSVIDRYEERANTFSGLATIIENVNRKS